MRQVGAANMRDQYNFLKAIDTSSSSPELKEASRPRRQQTTKLGLLVHEAASSSTSSASNKNQPTLDSGRGRAGLIRGTLQNLVRPRRFQLSSSNESRDSSDRRRVDGGHFARQEVDDQDEGDILNDSDDEEPTELTLDNALGRSHQRRLHAAERPRQPSSRSADNESDRANRQKPSQKVPIICQTRKRPLGRRAQLAANCTMTPPNETKLTSPNHNPNKSTSKTSAMLAAVPQQPVTNYSTSETNSAQLRGRLQELAQCYDEIDQIYDYIRGLAPLPANLRKIKAIDFEQIERERQRLKVSNQRQATAPPPNGAGRLQQTQHLHRQRFVKSIEPQNGAPSSTVDSGNENAKKPSRARQRVAAELIEASPIKSGPPPRAARQPSKLRETLQFLVPRPIRVTTKTSESQRPSIKRVESLNLGPTNLESAERQRLEAKLVQRDGLKTNSPRSPSYHLLKVSSSGGSDQLFRLPRAHSASTLSKPMNAPFADSRQKSVDKFGTVQAKQNKLKPHDEEPNREHSLPMARLKGISFDQNSGSLNRSAGKKRPSFESELVESYVDDEDNEHELNRDTRPPADPTSSSSTSLKSPVFESASGSWGRGTGGLDESRLSSPASRGRWSYADDSKKDQRQADKSHSDYDHDSTSETSETSAATSTEASSSSSSSTSDRSSASGSSCNENEEDEEIGRSLGKAVSSRRQASSKRSDQLRPTTSSSPSSGRPASPVDMTNESDEMEMSSVASQQPSSFASGLAKTLKQQVADGRRVQEQEHIYEQIPSHRERHSGQTAVVEPTGRTYPDQRGSKPFASLSTNLMLTGAPPKRTDLTGGSRGRHLQPVATNHPVAYAANVAANRRYQQQVAALFTLQQQRNRYQQPTAINTATSRRKGAPALASLPSHASHQRRASASNCQFVAPQATLTGGPMSLNVGSLKWKHQQAPRELTEVPHRQRLSMSNIHLLTGAIPLASLCSPRARQTPRTADQSFSTRESARPSKTRDRKLNASLLDDAEAASTGTTNSTSSYEAAIKNSEPDSLRIDMISPPSDGEQSRPASSKRSIGSASGSRSLTNQNQLQNAASNNQQASMLMKVPKLSKQSHLLKRPLPKPPSTNRSYGSSSGGAGYSRQLQTSSAVSKATAPGTQSTAVDVFS